MDGPGNLLHLIIRLSGRSTQIAVVATVAAATWAQQTCRWRR